MFARTAAPPWLATQKKVLGAAYYMPLAFSKGGGLQTGPCGPAAANAGGRLLYPPEQHPREWRGCGRDAYHYTWNLDENLGYLSSLSALDKLKLLRTMGFCPHQRCQLDNVTHSSGTSGVCPEGLCYTKVENGSPSFGACCFTDNVFQTSHLLGYHNKTQAVAKPIYRHSRIVLGEVFSGNGQAGFPNIIDEDTSLAGFINANMVAPGIIATQCPLLSTVRDAKQMILEQNISLWIQLAPFSDDGDYTTTAYAADASDARRSSSSLPRSSPSSTSSPSFSCGVFPIAHFSPGPRGLERDPLSMGISNFHIDATTSSRKGYTTISYEVAAYIKYRPIPETPTRRRVEVSYDDGDSVGKKEKGGGAGVAGRAVALWPKVRRRVQHVWFHAWRDFATPTTREGSDAIGALRELAERAASVVREGGTVAVSCVSGRGRSGTFAAMVMGHVRQVRNASELVDIIVDLRRNRDGLVETPRQFGLIAQVLDFVAGAGTGAEERFGFPRLESPIPILESCTSHAVGAHDLATSSFAGVFLLGSLSTLIFVVLMFVLLFCRRIAHTH